MNSDKIPDALKSPTQWIVWKMIDRDGEEPAKVLFQTNGQPAKSNDPGTWTSFKAACARFDRGGYSGIGFVFSAEDKFCGIDLDGCRDRLSGKVADWAREILQTLNSYSEVSPSGTGVKVFVQAKWPLDSGKKKLLDELPVFGKAPAIEVYDHGRYFAVTGQRLAGLSPDVEDRQEQINALCERFFPTPIAPAVPDWDSDSAVCERARKYVAKLPPAVSGQGGHNAAFHVACVLVCGFGLNEADATGLFAEWNQTCQPPWNEREIGHKIKSAAKQPGERNYLRNARQEEWARIRVPHYAAPKPQAELKITRLDAAAYDYLARLKAGNLNLVDTGLPEVDYAIGGGLEMGEMVILGARPSHGKSAIALQTIHNATASGMPCAMVSEEMSALALGKRTIQFASDVPREHWRTSADNVEKHLQEHFGCRAPCHVIEKCNSAERASDAIRETVDKHGVKLAVVDYAQLLTGEGKSRYEQISHVSITLRRLANDTGIILIVLCQLNRDVENRPKFIPQMSDLKDSGQLEQDCDVGILLCWPHRLDDKRDPNEFLFFVRKNRNREINVANLKCVFKPSRQMFIYSPVSSQVASTARKKQFDEYNRELDF